MIKHPKTALDSSRCLGCKTRGVSTPQQLRLFVPHVYDVANMHLVLKVEMLCYVKCSTYKYTIQVLGDNRIILHWLKVLFSGIIGNKINLLAPSVTFFMNLKECSREFLLTGPMV